MPGRGLFTSYRTAKKDVDAHFDALTKAGWTPQVDPDGKTYSWVNGKGETLRSGGDENLGVSAGAGWAERNLKREARQDRLMRDKVSSLLPKQPVKKKDDDIPKKGVDTTTGKGPTAAEIAAESKSSSASSWSAGPTEVPQYTKQPEKPIQDGEIPTGEPSEPKYDAVVEIPKNKETVSIASVFTTQEDKDPTQPYMYMTKEQIAKHYPSGVSSLWNRPWTPKRTTDVENMRLNNLVGAIGMQQIGPLLPSRKKDDKGNELVLMENPYFIPGTAKTEAEAKSLASKKGWGNRSVKKREDGYWQADVSTALDIIGNVLTGVQGVITPSNAGEVGEMARIMNARRQLSGAGNIGKIVDEAVPATKLVAKAAEQVAPYGKVTGEAAYKFNPEWLKNTFSNAGKVTRTPGTSVPFDMRKCGGKLVPKRKMKGK